MLGKLVRVTVLTSLISIPATLHAEEVDVSISVYPSSTYSGPCPVNVEFSAMLGIPLGPPRPLTYQWISSDGSESAPITIDFERGAVTNVRSTWTINASFEGWRAISIENPKITRAASFNIKCQDLFVLEHFQFVVLGDSQDFKIFRHLLDKVAQHNPKFVVFVGDIDTDAELGKWWEAHDYLKILTDRGIPVYNVVGNHEIGNPDGPTDEREEWLKLQQKYQLVFWNLPANGPPGYEHLAYSFEFRKSLFVIFDSFYIEPGSGIAYWSEISREQLDWFEATVAQFRFEHKFAFAHAPARYVLQAKDDYPFVQWLIANDFDAFFAGHEHLYARWLLGK